MIRVQRFVVRLVLLAMISLLLTPAMIPTPVHAQSSAPDSSAPAQVLLPPQFLPGDDAIGAAFGMQQAPAIARGSDSFLVVWADRRAAPSGSVYAETETTTDIYGIRLDAAGVPLDVVPFAITQGPSAQGNPQVAWNGSMWLVVYESYSVSGTGIYYQKSLEAVRVSAAGQILDAKPILLFGIQPSTNDWTVASDGNHWAIAYQGSTAGADILVRRVSSTGALLGAAARLLVPATYYMRFRFHLAYAAGVYLLTWSDNSATQGIRFDRDLTPLNVTPFNLMSPDLEGLAANDSGFYAVWHAQQPDFSMAVVGGRISTTGALLDGAGVNISLTHQPIYDSATRVVWDGVTWRAAWGYNGVSVARINTAGQVLDPGGVALPGLMTGATAPSPGGGLQIAWPVYNAAMSDDEIVSAPIAANQTAGPTLTLSVGAPSQSRPDLATSGSHTMVVFRSDTATGFRVMAQPLDANGNPTTAGPVQLDQGNTYSGPGHPSVAWNGSVYLVSWSTSSSIVAQRLQPDGAKIDPAPFLVMSSSFGAADVAALGDTFLVTGRRYGYTPETIYAIAARVRGSDGAVLDSTPLLLGGFYLRTPPAVVVLGGRWFVVFHSNWSHDNSSADTVGVFVNADGSKTAGTNLYGPFSTAGGNGIFEVGLASNGSVALLVQSAEISSGVETDLVARLINADGTLQPVFYPTPWRGNQYLPRAAWDGHQFIVVYTDQRNRLADLELLDARGDLFGMRISASGIVMDARGFLFSNSPAAEANPTIVASGGVAMIAASLMRHQAPLAANRVGYGRYGVGGNQWPVAVTAASANGGDVPLTVSFSSAGSSDPDGTIVGFVWDFGDGTTSTDANPIHTFTMPGAHVALLTLTDNQGAQTSNTVLVTATAPNQTPVVVGSASVYAGPPPLNVVFSTVGSYDPDGVVGNVSWDMGDGNSYWGGMAYNTYTTPGVYHVIVTAWDNRNGTGSDTLTIVVGGTPLAGDLNGDGHVNAQDLALAGQAWNTWMGDPAFDPRLDTNSDHRIAVNEVQWVAAHWAP